MDELEQALREAFLAELGMDPANAVWTGELDCTAEDAARVAVRVFRARGGALLPATPDPRPGCCTYHRTGGDLEASCGGDRCRTVRTDCTSRWHSSDVPAGPYCPACGNTWKTTAAGGV